MGRGEQLVVCGSGPRKHSGKIFKSETPSHLL